MLKNIFLLFFKKLFILIKYKVTHWNITPAYTHNRFMIMVEEFSISLYLLSIYTNELSLLKDLELFATSY